MNIEKSDFFSEDGSVSITEKGLKELETLVSIVLNKHFNLVKGVEREDLYQEGLLKALSLLNSGNFDTTKGKIHNFLYTGIRNEMGNYLYRINRCISVDDDMFCGMCDSRGGVESEVKADVYLKIPITLVKSVVEHIPDCNIQEVIAHLHYVGFVVQEGIRAKQNDSLDMISAIIIHRHIRSVQVNV